MDTAADKRYISPAEAAAELGVSKASVYRAIESGDLAHVQLRPHGVIRVPASAIAPKKEGNE